MPPKKKLCRSKDQRSIIEVFRGSSDESENSSNDQTKPAPLEDTPKQPPTNKFIPKWFKLYSWLKYNQEKDFMFCNICTEHGKRNGMVEHCQNRNFKFGGKKIGGFIKQSKNHLLVGNVILRVILTLMFVYI